MTSTTYPTCTGNVASERLAVLFEELSELAGQRNAIDGRIVEIAAEIEHDGLWGSTGARSVAALVAWKTGASSANAHTVMAIAPDDGVSPLRPKLAGGPPIAGSGRSDRRAGFRRVR
jgi:hypothetical protein